MRLQHATWQEVEAYLQHKRGVIVPIGSTEQHGPTGLLGTDAICPEVIAWELGKRHDVLVGPTQNLGMAQHHLAFPGTISLRPTTLIAVLRDTIESLAGHGFRHILFLNGHGGNIATLSAAFAEVYAERSMRRGGEPAAPLHLSTHNWFAGPRVRKLAESLYGDAEGTHATASEIALSWFAHPEAIKQAELTPRVAPRGSAGCDADEFRRRFPDGRMGSDPALASVEQGQQLYEAGVMDCWEAYRAFIDTV